MDNTVDNSHRALYKRTSIPRSAQEIHERRVAIDQSLRKKHREQLITAKRFRHLTRREERESTGEETNVNEHDEDIDPYYRLTPAQVQALANDLESDSSKIRIEAAQYLGKFVVEPSQALIDYIVHGDCIEALTRMMTGADPDEQLQAVQTLSNIAAGPASLWIKSTVTVPCLVTLLDTKDKDLRAMAAGALGNMAAEDLGDMTTEDDQVRAMIRNNGAVKPLVRMLEEQDSHSVQTACFALANLARGNESQVNELIEAGIAEPLFHHLKNETADTVTEICWVMSYLTASSEAFRRLVMQRGIEVDLVRDLRKLAGHGPAILPILRTIGNLASGPDEYIDVLVNQELFLSTLLILTHSVFRVIKKEALWVLSNITASKRPSIIKKVVEVGAVSFLTEILCNHGAYDIRKGAAMCLLNIAWHGDRYAESMPHKKLLPGFLNLIQSQEADIMRLGLSYVELLLTRVPKGNEVISMTPESMDVLASVTPSPDPQLYAFANQLVDQYYNETPGLDGGP